MRKGGRDRRTRVRRNPIYFFLEENTCEAILANGSRVEIILSFLLSSPRSCSPVPASPCRSTRGETSHSRVFFPISASVAEAESTLFCLVPQLRWRGLVQRQFSGNVSSECLLCISAFSPVGVPAGTYSMPTCALDTGGTSSLPHLRALPLCPLCLFAAPPPPPGPHLEATSSESPSLTLLSGCSPPPRGPSHSLQVTLCSATSEIIFFNSHGHCLLPHHHVGP